MVIRSGVIFPLGAIFKQPFVIYCSKDGKQEKVFDALEWIAAMGSHVPNKAEQMVRYYGYYSNVSRGKSQFKGSGL